MDRLYVFLCLFFSVTNLPAQFFNNGGVIHINSGVTLYSSYTISNSFAGSITNDGVLISTSSIVNFSGSSYQGDGTYYVGEDWINTSDFTAGNSTVIFYGDDSGSVFSGGDDFYNFNLQKSANAIISLASNARVTNELNFGSGGNKLHPLTSNLNIGPTATINGYDADNYIVTNNTGKVVKEQQTGNFVFPVGSDTATYNPIIVNQSGTVDDISVRVLADVKENGLSGATISDDVVAATWEVQEAVAGGSDLSLTAQWVAGDEEGSFNRNNSSIHHYDAAWVSGNFGPATGISDFTQIRTGITELGLFAVGGPGLEGGVVLDLHLMLEGPYAGSETMGDALRALPDFPTTEPYSGLGYTHHFRGGGESIDPGLLASTPIVDWVIVQLHDAQNPSVVVATKSAILLADGRVVDLDGASDLLFDGVASGNYYVAVDHRNHLGAMTASEHSLSRTASLIDFTAGGMLYGGSGAVVQKDLGVGVFGLYGGDLDVSRNVDASDRSTAWNNRNTSGYLTEDSTMDGTCDAEERSQAWNNRNKTSFIP